MGPIFKKVLTNNSIVYAGEKFIIHTEIYIKNKKNIQNYIEVSLNFNSDGSIVLSYSDYANSRKILIYSINTFKTNSEYIFTLIKGTSTTISSHYKYVNNELFFISNDSEVSSWKIRFRNKNVDGIYLTNYFIQEPLSSYMSFTMMGGCVIDNDFECRAYIKVKNASPPILLGKNKNATVLLSDNSKTVLQKQEFNDGFMKNDSDSSSSTCCCLTKKDYKIYIIYKNIKIMCVCLIIIVLILINNKIITKASQFIIKKLLRK